MTHTTGLRARILALLAAIATVFVVLVPASTAAAAPAPESRARSVAAADALSGSQFNPGNIISDDQFYQTGAMSASEIQAFLDAMIGHCTNTNCLNVYYAKTEKRVNDRNICTGYAPDSDALERVSTVIYKVQQACGISAKVILVTLQKEQGLVTHTGPTTGRLAAAMGWLCPDTAPCDGGGASLFRQIYGGAWQLKRYNTPDYFGNFHIGTYSIRYNPSASCGSKTVTIKNDATAALYNYTPYTPNAGALSNLYGTAPCGSYGNRNFWVYYNQWFGNPTTGDGLAHVAEEYTAQGGATGALGAAVGAGTCTRSVYSCYQTYEHGVVYWSSAFGAFTVSGAFGDYYLASGGVTGPLGPPSTVYTAISGPNGDGNTQKFAQGMIYSSAAGTFSIIGSMNTAFGDSGWVRGSMGWPTAERSCTTSAYCTQPTQTGMIYGTPTVAAALDTEMNDAYVAKGGPTGPLGWPKTNVTDIDAGAYGAGRTMRTVAGMLYEAPTGHYALTTRMQTAYEAGGWIRGQMGWPIADAVCTLPGGGCSQQFQYGDIYMPKTGAGYAIANPGMAAAYRSAGGPAGSLGWPITKTTLISGVGADGYAQAFASGAYMYSHGAAVVTLTKKYQAIYKTAGGIRGPLGWPTGAPSCTLPGGGCSIAFDNGTLYQPATGTGFTVSNSGIASAWAATGGITGPFGWPKSNTISMNTVKYGRGYAQAFAGGYIYSSAAGTFALPTAAKNGYAAAGGPRGALGWPVAEPVCDTTGCTQAFQGGTLYIPKTGKAFAVSDARIAQYYADHGGPGGTFGYPTTATVLSITTKNGRGYAQAFTGGYIYATALGTYAVTGPILVKYRAAKAQNGPLGFPKSDATCAGGTCTQTFAHGTLTTP